MGVLRSGLKRADAQLASLARVAKRAFMIAAAAATGAVLAAAKFQKQLAMVSTMLSQSTMKFMADYEQGLRRLAVQYGESTATLSKGLYDILSASIDAAKALGVLEIATKAAGAGMTTTAVSADAITTILNSYQMSAEQAGEVSDKLFATVKRGKLTFGELSASIGKASATAAIAGVSLDELLASIATITRAGIRSDQAMTAVVGTIRSFLKPTTEGAKLAKELGFELSTAGLRAEGLAGIFAKLTKLSADQLAVIFPNIRGLKGIAAAMQDLEGFTYDANLMMASMGLTQEAFNKTSNTLNFRLGQLKQSFLDMARAVGKRLMPFVEKLINGLKNLTRQADIIGWAKYAAGVIKWTLAISGLIIGVKALVGVLTLLAFHPVIAVFTVVAGLVAAVAIKMGALDGVVNQLKDGWDRLTESVKSFMDTQKEVTKGLITQAGEQTRQVLRLATLAKQTRRTVEEDEELIKIEKELIAMFPKLRGQIEKTAKTGETTPGLFGEIEKGAREELIKNLEGQIQSMRVRQSLMGEHVERRKKAMELAKKEFEKTKRPLGPMAAGFLGVVVAKLTEPEDESERKRATKIAKEMYEARKKTYEEYVEKKKDIDENLVLEEEKVQKRINSINEIARREDAKNYAKWKAKWKRDRLARKEVEWEKRAKSEEATGKEMEVRAEAERLAHIKGLQKSIPAMSRIASEFGQSMLPPKEQWEARLAEVEKRFGKESPFYKATNQLFEAAMAAKTTAGRWVSITDLYKQIQSAVMRPEKKFDKAALDLYKKMLTQLKNQTKLLEKERAGLAA